MGKKLKLFLLDVEKVRKWCPETLKWEKIRENLETQLEKLDFAREGNAWKVFVN